MNLFSCRIPEGPRELVSIFAGGLVNLSAKLQDTLRIFERRCPVCHGVFADSFTPDSFNDLPDPMRAACPACRHSMSRRLAGYCPHCGELALDACSPNTPCGKCLSEPPLWTNFRFHGVFEGALREALHRAKFSADSACLALLASILADICRDLPELDAIVPMPLHPDRLRVRGFNQCREIARLTARRRNVPIRDSLLLKTRHTPPQTSLSRKARLANLDNAFAASSQAKGLRLLLVDDTSTTGTSLRKGAEALIRAGAARVDVAVIARAVRHDLLESSHHGQRMD